MITAANDRYLTGVYNKRMDLCTDLCGVSLVTTAPQKTRKKINDGVRLIKKLVIFIISLVVFFLRLRDKKT